MSDLSTSLTIPDHFRRKFSREWHHVLQQKTAKFAAAGLLAPDWTGKEYVWTDLDSIEATETTGLRFGDSNPEDISGGKRKGYKRSFDVGIKRDQFDNKWLDQMALPDSELINTMKAALARKQDQVVVDAVVADALGGADPYNTSIPLPAAQKVAVNYILGGTGSNSGLTPYKILAATQRFRQDEVDLDQEELFLAISPRQEADLVAYLAAAPNDVWAKVVGEWLSHKERGMLTKLMGCTVIYSNRLTLDATTDIRTCAVWAKSALRYSPLDTTLRMDIIPAKRHMLQIMDYMHFGAVRVNDKKVQLIYTDESP